MTMENRMTLINVRLLVTFCTIGLSNPSWGHGGGLDQSGCHHNRKTGDYHCHRAPSPAPIVQPAPAQQVSAIDNTCHTGPRGGRYRIVNGKKRYGC
ncbi:YHYH domain-containing protein [Propionivibrio dicarboxylicus]|uniref:YHYH domain-containing protein n=1 Tax=Propionivibrio dicarboxylicus TaxID=83767 RepID=UPI003CCB767E